MFEKFKSPTLFFSGGRDSLATLLFLRPYWHEITVAWSNSGASPQSMVDYMASIAARVPNFVELRGNQPAWIRANGWPVDVVPVESTAANHGAVVRTIQFAPRTSCCGANMWEPLQRYIQTNRPTLVITGQRLDEVLRNRQRDGEFTKSTDGVTYWNPINAWDETQVMAYLREQGEPLPPGYADGATKSVDCWNCTDYVEHNAERYASMQRNEPEKWEQIHSVLRELGERLRIESKPLFDLIGA